MKKITTFFLFMAVFMGSGANAQQPVKGDAFFAKYDQGAQALIKEHGAEKIVVAYLNGNTYSKYWRISSEALAEWIYTINQMADERGFSTRVTSSENASDMFCEYCNYGTETVAQLEERGFKTLKIGRMLNGKVDFYDQPLSGLADNIEFGGLYDANSAFFFPIIKKGIKGSQNECCLNLCYPVYPEEEDDTFVDQGGDGGGEQYSGQKVQRSSSGDVYVYNYNTISNSGNADQSQDQTQTVSAPAPQQQGSGFVNAEIAYKEVPMQAPVNYGTNYNAGYSAPPTNYGNNGTVVYNNRPNGLDVADFIVDVATLGVAGYGAYKSWQIYNKPAPIYNVTGGKTTYGNNTYNAGTYGNGLLNPFGGNTGGTGGGTGGGPVGPTNGGLLNDQ